MSVYIPGFEIPTIEGNRAIKAEIRQINGKLEFGIMTGGYSCCQQWTYYPLISVPPHSLLIVADALEKYKETRYDSKTGRYEEVISMASLRNITAIIPEET